MYRSLRLVFTWHSSSSHRSAGSEVFTPTGFELSLEIRPAKTLEEVSGPFLLWIKLGMAASDKLNT